MKASQGFSLTEVLVSLFIATSATLGLLTQQWQISRLFNYNLVRTKALIALENDLERIQSGFDLSKTQHPFTRTKISKNHVVTYQYSWLMSLTATSEIFYIKQQLLDIK